MPYFTTEGLWEEMEVIYIQRDHHEHVQVGIQPNHFSRLLVSIQLSILETDYYPFFNRLSNN